MNRQALSAVCAVALGAVALMARADGGRVVLHEYMAPDPNEALTLGGGRSTGSDTATAIQTPSGPIVPPDLEHTPPPSTAYDSPQDASSSTFHPDRDTRRPDHETYDDPFTPQLTPFKRMTAFDAVREDYTLYVRDPALKAVTIRTELDEGDDRFFGDLAVELRAGDPVRIPNVAAGARLRSLVVSPPMPVDILRDGADNWFARSNAGGRVRLVVELATKRDGFAADFPDVPWRALEVVPPPPKSQRAAYERVARAIGLTQKARPREVVTRLTEYFRSFAPSDEPPRASADIYLDLALSKKGVCRHRSFAFLVTALHAGIPTRLVSNEAHAWVEVHDGRLWRRIDLGGAAVDLQHDPRLDRPQHVPPPDAFAWPAGRDGGAELGAKERREAEAKRAASPMATSPENGAPEADPSGAAPTGSAAALEHGREPGAEGETYAESASNPSAKNSEVVVDDIDRELFRGKPMRLRGRIVADGAPCGGVRVDVLIQSADGSERRVGSLATDERGAYDGEVRLPRDLAVGDYELVVATPGNKTCGASRSK